MATLDPETGAEGHRAINHFIKGSPFPLSVFSSVSMVNGFVLGLVSNECQAEGTMALADLLMAWHRGQQVVRTSTW